MNHCRSFPPSAGEDAEILILGSMPGGESLRQNQYYAFKHNAFWRIAGEIFGFAPALPYAERLKRLHENKIALWDVLACCERPGSLDSSIKEPLPNDIAGFLNRHPAIWKICCNGQTAGKYLKRFFPDLPVEVEILPSTSPAAASYSYAAKLKRWKQELTSRR